MSALSALQNDCSEGQLQYVSHHHDSCNAAQVFLWLVHAKGISSLLASMHCEHMRVKRGTLGSLRGNDLAPNVVSCLRAT